MHILTSAVHQAEPPSLNNTGAMGCSDSALVADADNVRCTRVVAPGRESRCSRECRAALATGIAVLAHVLYHYAMRTHCVACIGCAAGLGGTQSGLVLSKAGHGEGSAGNAGVACYRQVTGQYAYAPRITQTKVCLAQCLFCVKRFFSQAPLVLMDAWKAAHRASV